MNISTAIIVSISYWTQPSISPCIQPDGTNLCWIERLVPAPIIEARAAGRFKPDEICDGDTITNTSAHNGEAFGAGIQTVAFSEQWLHDKGITYTAKPDGRLCIPSVSYEDWHEALICGNAVRMIRRYSAIRREAGGYEFTRRGALLPRTLATGGGARSRGAAPLTPGGGVFPPPPYVPPYVTPYVPPVVEETGEKPEVVPPVTEVPVPASFWFFVAAMAGLFAMRRRA